MAHLPEITGKTYQKEILESDLPVLVDLYATWCPPCKVMGEMLDKLAPQLAGRAKLVKINVDAEKRLAEIFNVSGVPTLVLVDKGRVVDGYVGLIGPKEILKMVDKLSPPAAVVLPRR